MGANKNDEIFCSFCGKNRREVSHLVGGRAVYICSECWELCAELFAKAYKVDPSLVYLTVKSGRLDQAELFARRAMAICRTEEVLGISGAKDSDGAQELDVQPAAETHGKLPAGG